MKNILNTTFFSILILHSLFAQCPNKLYNNQLHRTNTKYTPIDTTLGKVKTFSFQLKDIQYDYLAMFDLGSHDIINISINTYENCSLGQNLYQDSLNSPVGEINLNDLPKDEELAFTFTFEEESNSVFKLKIIEKFKNYTNKEYNKKNNLTNPVPLDIIVGDMNVSDQLTGIRISSDKSYEKWYHLNFDSEIKYSTFKLENISGNAELKIYAKENNALIETNEKFINSNKLVFNFLNVQEKDFYLKIQSDSSYLNNYDLYITSEDKECDVNQIIEYDFEYSNYNKKKLEINPGDTLQLDFKLIKFKPYNYNWIHSLIEVLPEEFEHVDVEDLYYDLTANKHGQFHYYDAKPTGINNSSEFKGPGYYYNNNKFGPYGKESFETWGVMPSFENDQLPIASFRSYIVIDNFVDCNTIDTLEYSLKLNLDPITGSYSVDNCYFPDIEIKVPLECCPASLQNNDPELCFQEQGNIKIFSDKIYNFTTHENIKAKRIDTNEFTIYVTDTSYAENIYLLEFYTNDPCGEKLQTEILRYQRSNYSIAHPQELCLGQETLLSITGDEFLNQTWHISGSKTFDQTSQKLTFQNETDIVVEIEDLNKCTEIVSSKILKDDSCNSIYDFSINPNPAAEHFGLRIFKTQIIDNSINSFYAIIVDNDGVIHDNYLDLTLGLNKLKSRLPSGSYYIQLYDENRIFLNSKKLIVIK